MFSCFLTGIDNPEEEGKKVLKSIHYESAPGSSPRADRRRPSSHPSGWTLTKLSTRKVGIAEGLSWVLATKLSTRKVSTKDFGADSPTADIEVHSLVCCCTAAHEVDLHSADVTSAYFQGRPSGSRLDDETAQSRTSRS